MAGQPPAAGTAGLIHLQLQHRSCTSVLLARSWQVAMNGRKLSVEYLPPKLALSSGIVVIFVAASIQEGCSPLRPGGTS